MRALISLLLVACATDAPPDSDPGASTPATPTADTATSTPTPTPTADTGPLVDSAPTGATGDTATATPMAPGTYREQVFVHDGEDRAYLLHVPAAYDGRPMPMLVDLHGTAGEVPPPEEAYGLDGAIDTAEAEGFLLLRPRSRSSTYSGLTVYRWDQNPGDPELNTDFVLDLVEALGDDVAIDLDRLYVMGFSSGTNQTAMLAQVAGSPFDGFGHVGGGAWWTSTQPIDDVRVYLATPFRDYMRRYHHALIEQLDAHAHPDSLRLERLSMSGHELYDGMYPELWAWLDRGEAPPEGAGLEAGWSASDAPAALAAHPDGDGVWLAGADVLGRFDGTTFQVSAIEGSSWFNEPMEITGVCLTGSVGAAVGNGVVLWTDDGGLTFQHREPVAEPGPPMFGYAHWNGVGCHQGRVQGVGYWSAGESSDGVVWDDVALGSFGYRAQVVATTPGPSGNWVSAGYYRFLAVDGVSVPGGSLGSASWMLDSAHAGDGIWVAVGDHGTLLRSTDDAGSWSPLSGMLPDDEELNAVAFSDDGVGLAVGRAGSAWRSDDQGATWVPVPLGLHRLLADVAWLTDGSAVVVGPEGSFRYTP